jgi:putative transposase
LAVRYVERNPVRAGLVRRPEEYPWSSARGHVGTALDPLVEDGNAFEQSVTDWATYLSEGEPEEWCARLRHSTLTGRPLGSESFVARMEEALGRRLRALPRGRPKMGTATIFPARAIHV